MPASACAVLLAASAHCCLRQQHHAHRCAQPDLIWPQKHACTHTHARAHTHTHAMVAGCHMPQPLAPPPPLTSRRAQGRVLLAEHTLQPPVCMGACVHACACTRRQLQRELRESHDEARRRGEEDLRARQALQAKFSAAIDVSMRACMHACAAHRTAGPHALPWTCSRVALVHAASLKGAQRSSMPCSSRRC